MIKCLKTPKNKKDLGVLVLTFAFFTTHRYVRKIEQCPYKLRFFSTSVFSIKKAIDSIRILLTRENSGFFCSSLRAVGYYLCALMFSDHDFQEREKIFIRKVVLVYNEGKNRAKAWLNVSHIPTIIKLQQLGRIFFSRLPILRCCLILLH